MLSNKDLSSILEKHKYTLVEPIGKKCFPTCFRVHSIRYDDDFVVKVVKKKKAFNNEADKLKYIFHPHIIKLYEFFEESNFGFLILEYCSGGSLEDAISEMRHINQSVINSYISDLINVVSFLHQKGIAHLDIKPSNILVDKFGKIKLCDFGVSGYFPSGISNSHVGTYVYMSPEMKENMPYDPFQADVWSLGVTIHFIVCGYIPLFVRKADAKVVIPNISNKLIKDLITGALVKDPAERITIEQMQGLIANTNEGEQPKMSKKSAFAASKFAPIAKSVICRNSSLFKTNATHSFKY